MLLFNQDGAEFPAMNEMISLAKRKFVNNRHSKAISQMVNASGFKKGKWKTYVEVDGRRKEVIRNSEEELYEILYEHYKALEDKPKTLKDVFTQCLEYKRDCLGRTLTTIRQDEQLFDHISEKLQNTPIMNINDEEIKKWLIRDYLKTKPTETRMKKMLQLIGQIFDYGIRQHICYDNPMKYISSKDYAAHCNLYHK